MIFSGIWTLHVREREFPIKTRLDAIDSVDKYTFLNDSDPHHWMLTLNVLNIELVMRPISVFQSCSGNLETRPIVLSLHQTS